MRTITLALLLLLLAPLVADESKPPMLTPEEQKLAAEANNLIAEGFRFYQQGKRAEAAEKLQLALEIRQRLYPESRYPDGHPEVAQCLNNLGLLYRAMGAVEKGLSLYEQCLAMDRRLYPTSKFPDGHPNLALSLNNVGAALQSTGAVEKALPMYEQALAMRRRIYPASRYPNGHSDLAQSLNNMGAVLNAAGSVDQAVPYFEQALAMKRRLYPDSPGHADLARGLSSMGAILQVAGQTEKALPYLEQALEMRRRLYPAERYPGGHLDVAASLTNMGLGLQAVQLTEKALPFHDQAVSMYRRLFPADRYPEGHSELARSLNNLGSVWQAMGAPEKAQPYHDNALAMFRKLYPKSTYPDGHPDLAQSLSNLGFVLLAMGAEVKALPHFEEALAMRRSLGRRMLRTAAEAEALAYLGDQVRTRDGFLSLTQQLSGHDAAAYDSVWESKSAVMRLLQQRHIAARGAGKEHAGKLDDLKARRRRIDQLLQDQRLPPGERDLLLTKLANERDRLERELAAAIPLLQRADELNALGSDALAPLLPPGRVFIDVVRYTRFAYDRQKKGSQAETQTPSYAVFVLAPGRSVTRIDLQAAGPIDAAVRQWRAAIEAGRAESSATADLVQHVWHKIAPSIPAETQALYIAADGDLARLPWAALPVRPDRVLLESYALAQAPHGPFLLEQFKYPSTPQADLAGDELFALGEVDYGDAGRWPALPATKSEVDAIVALAPGKWRAARGASATPANLKAMLPTARFVHLATHGEFQADALTAERKRAEAAVAARPFGDDTRRIAANNPLAYVGLVLSKGEVLSGLSILDLPLENLKLVTLSACETGLGELAGAEGVQGLQRAFHLAGCPNVVASLWKVNDAATAALMAKFYHEMWVNKKPPIEALREAQLTIYRHPERIPALSGERGKPDFAKTVELKPDLNPDAGAQGSKRTPTKLWAAFVLSGVGK